MVWLMSDGPQASVITRNSYGRATGKTGISRTLNKHKGRLMLFYFGFLGCLLFTSILVYRNKTLYLEGRGECVCVCVGGGGGSASVDM